MGKILRKKQQSKSKDLKVQKPKLKKLNSESTSEVDSNRPTHYYLIKSEPESRFENGIDMKFSIEDLKSRPNQTEHWDGVRNYSARNVLKSMRLNDLCFFYHSNCKSPGIVGVVKVVKEYYPDSTQFDEKNPHYDPKSDPDDPRWGMVDVQFVRDFRRPVTLAELKELSGSKDCPSPIKSLPLLSRARLSCQPLTSKQWESVLALESSEILQE